MSATVKSLLAEVSEIHSDGDLNVLLLSDSLTVRFRTPHELA